MTMWDQFIVIPALNCLELFQNELEKQDLKALNYAVNILPHGIS